MNSSKQAISLREFLHKEKFSLIVIFICYILASRTSIWSLTAGLMFALVYCSFIKRVSISRYFRSLFLLLLVSSFFVYFSSVANGYSFLYAIKFPIPMLCSYLLGRFYSDRYRSEEIIVFMILFMAVTLGLFHMTATLNDILTVGLVNPERSLATLGEIQRSTTQRTTELSLCIACLCMLFIPIGKKESTFLKSAYIVVGVIAILCELHYVSRTGVALIIITFAIGLVYRWRMSWKTLFLILLIIKFYSIIQTTELYQVFETRETDVSNLRNAGLRTERWEWGVDYLWNNPWGNVSFGEYQLDFYAHNFWLDFGIAFGLIASVFMVSFSFCSFYSSIKIVRKKAISKKMSLIYMTFSIIFILTLFSEPIIYGAPNFMMMYFMFCGLIERQI